MQPERLPRLNEKIKITVVKEETAEKPTPENDNISETKNVSQKGLCFLHASEISPGKNIQINLNIPFTSAPISLSGTVIWCKKAGDQYEIGLSFSEVKSEYDSWITNILINGLKSGKHQDKESSKEFRFRVDESK